MTTWGFEDENGVSLARGWQGYEFQARRLAQLLANERQQPVDFWEEGSDMESETVWPEEEART